MSLSSFFSAAVYRRLPVPPGTSLSWMPPSSLYCCHRSVSRISSADRKRRIAASPADRLPLLTAAAAGEPTASTRPTPVAAAPNAAPPIRKERRLVLRCSLVSMITPSDAQATVQRPPYERRASGRSTRRGLGRPTTAGEHCSYSYVPKSKPDSVRAADHDHTSALRSFCKFGAVVAERPLRDMGLPPPGQGPVPEHERDRTCRQIGGTDGRCTLDRVRRVVGAG